MFSSNTYSQRRLQLARTVSSGLILLPGNEESPMNYADNTYHYRQDSTFLYYFGIDQPSLAGIIDADSGESILFGDDYDIDMIVWTGVVPSIASLGEKAGIKDVRRTPALADICSEAMVKGRPIHFLNPYRSDILLKVSELTNIKYSDIPGKVSLELTKAVVAQREIKSEEEIAEIEKFKSFSGLRNEEDYLITEDGARLMGKALPMSIEGVEAERAL